MTRSFNPAFSLFGCQPAWRIIDAVGDIAAARGVTRAHVALAWLHHQPGAAAPLVGVSKLSHLDDALASLGIQLTGDELARLEAPYTRAMTSRASATRRRWPASRPGSASGRPAGA